MLLFQNNQPIARIHIATNASIAEQRAASEFQRMIRQMSDAELPIVTDYEPGSPGVYIGRAAPVDQFDLSEERLGCDGYLVKCDSHSLFLTGRRDYSALYAVYHVFERYLGCGFFEEGDQIPRRDTCEMKAVEDYCRPRFEWRIYFPNMQDAYSGMRWWTWEEFKPWVDYLVKKRFTLIESGNLTDCCGIGAMAATRMGIPIALTDWQKKRIALLRRVLDYAREAGLRILYRMHMHVGTPNVQPGFSPYIDGAQLQEFVYRYEKKYNTKITVAPLEWCGEKEIVLEPSDPVTQRFTTECVLASIEALGTDHQYSIWLPTEEAWVEDDPQRAADLTHASVHSMINAIKAGDPDAFVFSPRVCTDNPTAAAQAEAVREAGLPVIGNMFLNHSGRMYDFLRTDYYWGLPWSTGMCGQCGRETNPNGDIHTAVMNARSLIDHPKATELNGFMVSSETNRRNVMTMDLYAELSWNPAEVDPDDFIDRWNRRRYGDAAAITRPAVELFAETIMSYFDSCTHNGPLYRNWDGTGLAGLTSGSVKRLIGYLPALRDILRTLLAAYDQLECSPMYRFDLIDLGRTYLAGIFNDRLARTRKAFRAGDRTAFEKYAGETEQVMHAMARYCSAHEQFRLKTHDEWAARWPKIIPGHDNSESNWITFTALISLENWVVLLDYLPEDFAEMVEHYFLPRVQQYLQKMREMLDEGRDISGRQVDRGTDIDLPSRVANWSTPQGNAIWSPYGDTCEPELTADDEALAYELITQGTVSGRYAFYEGPLDTLVQDMLAAWPPPDDIEAILAEQDYTVAGHRTVLAGVPGETIEGFNVPGFVERVVLPESLKAVISVREIRREYNIARGEITLNQVIVPPDIKLTREDNEPAESGDHDLAVFLFEFDNIRYRLKYDNGTDLDVASLTIQSA